MDINILPKNNIPIYNTLRSLNTSTNDIFSGRMIYDTIKLLTANNKIKIKNINELAHNFAVTIELLFIGFEYKNSMVPSLSSFTKEETPKIAP